MKALVYTNPLEVQIQNRPEPDLVAGEVVLRIDAVGICGSDMHAYHGHDPRRKPGLVLGHEFCGTIVKSDVPGFALGQRVTGNVAFVTAACKVVTTFAAAAPWWG
jgi:threonine dehydrogenase-like Zn-dependent dehydrogenase